MCVTTRAENQNTKTWPTIYGQIQPVRYRGRKISTLGPWLLDYYSLTSVSDISKRKTHIDYACFHKDFLDDFG